MLPLCSGRPGYSIATVPVEIIGMIGVRPEGRGRRGGARDRRRDRHGWVRDFAQAHETAGFDRVLVGYTSTSADGFSVTAYAAAHTERLGYLIAHRPGFVAPTLAARTAATLDHSRTAASRCTSSPAAATPSRRATATGSTTTRATAAPTSTSD